MRICSLEYHISLRAIRRLFANEPPSFELSPGMWPAYIKRIDVGFVGLTSHSVLTNDHYNESDETGMHDAPHHLATLSISGSSGRKC